MRKIKSDVLAFYFLSMVGLPGLFAQDAIAKAVESINQHLLLNEYERAYSYATCVVRFYRSSPMPIEAVDAVEKAVSRYGSDLASRKEWDRILEMDQALSEAPESVKTIAAGFAGHAREALAKLEEEQLARERELEQARLAREREQELERKRAEDEARRAEQEQARLAEIETALRAERELERVREETRAKEREEARAREDALLAERAKVEEAQRAQIDRIIEESRRLELEKERFREEERIASEARQRELELRQSEMEAKYREELTLMFRSVNEANTDTLRSVSSSSRNMIFGLGILSLFVIAGITLLITVSLRQQRLQHEQFNSTLQAMNAMRNAAPRYDAPLLPFSPQDMGGIRALPGGQTLMIEGPAGQNGAQPDGQGGTGSGSEALVMRNMLTTCQSYGQEIDRATGRRNASRLVADLVYKLSRQLGYSEQDSILFFAVGLVYDIGFLNIDPSILRADHISEEQFGVIRTHTTVGLNMVFFIDEKYRELFKDGVSKHHENLDGTGYPFGLKDGSIPYIARVLRTVESYIALISKRDYREIQDRDSAIAELMRNHGQYDQDIVRALDTIV